MEALYFESKPPFIIKVYDTYFQITWDGSVETPQDKYPYEKVNAIEMKTGKEKKKSLLDDIYERYISGRLAKKIREYDEILIKLKNGETETRYVHGQITETMSEAIEIIRTKLNAHNIKKH